MLTEPKAELTEAECDAISEQNDYLFGVLCADKEHRMNSDEGPHNFFGQLPSFDSGSKHFWRGVIEAGGHIRAHGIATDQSFFDRRIRGELDKAYAEVVLEAQPWFLRRFLAFLEETLGTTQKILFAHNCPPVMALPFDTDRKYYSKCGEGKLRFTHVPALRVIGALYGKYRIGRESCRTTVLRIHPEHHG